MTDFLAKGAQKGDHLQPAQNPDAEKAHSIRSAKVININGGGGENCTRVQSNREISYYKLSSVFIQ